METANWKGAPGGGGGTAEGDVPPDSPLWLRMLHPVGTKAWKFPLVEECGRHSWSYTEIQCKARMSLGMERLEELFSEFISRGCPSSSQPLSRSKEIPQFSCLTDAENLPGWVFPLSNGAPHLPGDAA